MTELPAFPEFKQIELADRSSVEKLTEKFPPYSDFHFSSLYSWDINKKMGLSVLNGNLVVLFNDYISGSFFLTFIGDSKISETASILLDFSKQNGYESSLKLIPEEMAKVLSETGFSVEPDAGAHDYIYSIERLANMEEWSKSTQKKQIRKFMDTNPQYSARILPTKELDKREYLELFKQWATNKNLLDHTELNEYKAFSRLLAENNGDVEMLSIYSDESCKKMIGFTSFETISDDYAIAHFSKADIKHHAAIYCVLIWEEAKYLQKKGIKHYNWEQDLDIPGLRTFKMSYKPEFFLKQYTVSLPVLSSQS
ncbi:MAG: phosphatidylglycerol lysyltransferase domain-containing protein [Candidatus Paceibacterota bacterium]|jgi:hypothetical protein